ncbi:MAG: hydroxymethylbilane synthase [Peptococcaceae bacterium]|nr:hydroxymethylbilane synthase [Peptococcaceae bacterium]
MHKRLVRVGTRGSALALKQTEWVIRSLREVHPEVNFEIKKIKTLGDSILDVALAKIGDKGIFTKEIEKALLGEEIDLAVHSMKDLPTILPPGLVIGAVTVRHFPGDVLISADGSRLDELPRGARIGSSSLRRRAQLLAYRPDLQMTTVRGNLQTRLKKLEEGQFDATILAWVGLHRLGMTDVIAQRIPFTVCLPAVGQGALAVEIRSDDTEMADLVRKIDHRESRSAVTAERTLMHCLEGGCQVPIGAVARLWGGTLILEAMVGTLDGRRLVRTMDSSPIDQPEQLGIRVADKLLKLGAADILAEVRERAELDG